MKEQIPSSIRQLTGHWRLPFWGKGLHDGSGPGVSPVFGKLTIVATLNASKLGEAGVVRRITAGFDLPRETKTKLI